MSGNFSYSAELAIYSYLFYIVMFIIASPYKNYKKHSYVVHSKGIILFFICYALLNVFSFWEYDTYHTWEDFQQGTNLYGYEDIYQKLAQNVGDSYFLWRSIVWIPACLFLYKSASYLKLVNSKLLLSIVLFGGFIGYTRAMLGFTILLYGVILFVDSENKRTKLIGLLIVVLSYFFHKSMYVAILFAFFALYPLKRKQIKLLLIIFPILASLTTFLVVSFSDMFSLFNLSAGVGDAGDGVVSRVLDNEKLLMNTSGKIMKIIEICPQYMIMFYMGIQIYKKKIFENLSHQFTFHFLFRFAFWGFYVASLFYFTDFSSWIYERFKHIAFFPMLIVLTAFFTYEKSYSKWMRNIVLYQMMFVILSNFLRVYLNS